MGDTFPPESRGERQAVMTEQVAAKTALKFYPCKGESYHDFAVGENAAVCNRCASTVEINRHRRVTVDEAAALFTDGPDSVEFIREQRGP
jgi:hypothetical protein